MTKDNGGDQEVITFLRQRDYRLVKELGQGSCGKTVLLHDDLIDEQFVCKKYLPASELRRQQLFTSFVREVKLLHRVLHPNVVRIFNHYLYPQQFAGYLLMEYVNGVPLDEYADSVGKGSTSLYQYAYNDPIGYSDPLGLRPLSDREKAYLEPYIPWQDLQNADIHEGTTPWYLPGQYVGITRGNDIYFRPGYYDPYSPDGIARLGHELVHVGQYREGATWLSFLWSYRHGYENSKYEIPAYAMQDRILYGLTHPEAGACMR